MIAGIPSVRNILPRIRFCQRIRPLTGWARDLFIAINNFHRNLFIVINSAIFVSKNENMDSAPGLHPQPALPLRFGEFLDGVAQCGPRHLPVVQ